MPGSGSGRTAGGRDDRHGGWCRGPSVRSDVKSSLTLLTRVAIWAVVAALLGACGAAPTPAGPVPVDRTWAAPRAVPAGMGSAAADGVFPRTVTHFGGTSEIRAVPVRVVVLGTGQLDAALSLGVVPVGSTRGDDAGLVPVYLSAAYPDRAADLAAMTDLGLRLAPSLEAITRVRPDLILANKAGSDELYPKLAAIAPTVLSQGTGVNWKQDLLLLAHVLGRAQTAGRLLDSFQADAAALGDRAAAPVTVSFLRVTTGRTRVFGVPSFTGSIAQDAGLERPPSQLFDATSRDISSEQLGLADADHVFYAVQGGGSPEQLGESLLSSLGAVAAGRAVPVDDDVWYLDAGPTAARMVLDGLASAAGPTAS